MAPYFTFDKDVELRESSGEMNSVLGSGKLSVSPSGQEQATLLQATVSGSKSSGATGASIAVGNVLTFPLVTSSTQKPFKVIDTRTVLFATDDYMTNYYVTFPKGTDTSVVTELTRVLSALAEGKEPSEAALMPYPSCPSATLPSAAETTAAAVAAPSAPPAPPAAPKAVAAAAAAAAQASSAPSQPTASDDAEKPPPAQADTTIRQVTGFMGALWNAGSGMVQKAGDELKKKAAEDTKALQELGGKISQRAQQDTKILMDAATGKGATSQEKPAEKPAA